jgi:hypothetical protein
MYYTTTPPNTVIVGNRLEGAEGIDGAEGEFRLCYGSMRNGECSWGVIGVFSTALLWPFPWYSEAIYIYLEHFGMPDLEQQRPAPYEVEGGVVA